MRIVVLLGAPGAGKGTHAPDLATAFGLIHLSTGDLLRAEVRAGTPLGSDVAGIMGRGELVPDRIVIELLLGRLGRPDAAAGAILDGFPRTAAQAAALDGALAERGSAVEVALLIDVSPDEMVRRLTGRWICEAGGHVYNVAAGLGPRVAGRCDVDGSPLVQRADDREETVRARLAGTLPALEEVIEHYRTQGRLRTVDGLRAAPEVGAALADALRSAVGGDA